MRDDGVVEFSFEEVGVIRDGAEVGMFSGTASIDQDGAIVGLTLDAYVTDKTDPLGIPKKVPRYFRVPLAQKAEAFCTFSELLAREIAATISNGFEPEIKEKVDGWHVERAEDSWSPKKEYGTLRAIEGSVA